MSFMQAGQQQPALPPPPPLVVQAAAPPPAPAPIEVSSRAAAATSGTPGKRVSVTEAMSKKLSPASVFDSDDRGLDPLRLRRDNQLIDELDAARRSNEISAIGR